MKKLLLIPAYLLLTVILYASCCNDSCCGETFTQSYFRHTDVFSELHRISSLETWPSSDAVDLETSPLNGNSISADSLAINFRFETAFYTSASPKPFNFSFLNKAYACSPPEPTSKEVIDSISITSSTDYDSLHPAGSELSALFNLVYPKYNNKTIAAADTFLNYQVFNYYDFYSLIPTSAPSRLNTFTFQVKIYHSGIQYKTLRFETDSITLF